MIIPPYTGVRLVEYHDHIALKPISSHREILGLCKISKDEKDFKPFEGMNPLMIELQKEGDIWLIIQWHVFEDQTEETINIHYLAQVTETDANKAYDEAVSFLKMSKKELEELQGCYKPTDDDLRYIPERFPLECPDPSATEDYDLYQARLRVLAGMQPKTVALIEQAYSAENLTHRADSEFEAVSAYYAEMAHYWTSAAVKAWQRSNPIATEWIKEFARVFQKPRKELDAVDHEIVLNWLRRGYNLLTAEELSEAIFQVTGNCMTPEALKKRRERLGLTTKRPPGPRPNSER